MGIAENKAIAVGYLTAMSHASYEAAASALADDVVWRIGGFVTYAGKEAILTKSRSAASQVDMSTVSVEIRNVLADGDFVAIETHLRMNGTNGKPYENYYAHLLEIRNGQITAWREYFDMTVATAAGAVMDSGNTTG
jgi:ketosteroid isomerase-like protein